MYSKNKHTEKVIRKNIKLNTSVCTNFIFDEIFMCILVNTGILVPSKGLV